MNRTCKTWLLGLAASAALSLASTAADAANVNFSVNLPIGVVGGGSVAGYLTGLSDNATGAATGVYLTSVTPSLGTGSWGLNQDLLAIAKLVYVNSITISSGVVTALQFDMAGWDSNENGQRLTLNRFSPGFLDILPDTYDSGFRNVSVGMINSTSSPNVTATFESAAPTDTPEPASFALLGAALVGFAASRRRSA